MARSEFGRQIGFVESSLSSDEEEEEEVARGSEERDCQGDEDKEFGRGGEDKEKCRGGEAQKLPRQGLVQLQPAVADLLVRFLHCTSSLVHCFQKLLSRTHLHPQYLPQVILAQQHQGLEVDSLANKLNRKKMRGNQLKMKKNVMRKKMEEVNCLR